MGTITKRKKKDGTISYTAQIRMTVDGHKYTESESSTNEKALKAWMVVREQQMREPGAIEHQRHVGTTVGQVLNWYKEDFQGASKFGRSKLSHIDYLIRHPEFSSLDAINLTSATLIQHARDRAKTAGPGTINNDFVWLRNAFNAVRLSRNMPLAITAVDDAMLLMRKEGMIAKAKQRNRRPELCELSALLEHFKKRDKRSKVQMVDIVLFALFSSRRQEEICRIRWEDLDDRRRGVMVRDMKHPRQKTDTFVFFTAEAWAIIQRQDRVADEIFPYNSKSVSDAFTTSCSFLEIEDLRFHDLRHECVSWLFELGWDIPKVSGVSGHKSWASLQRYTHIREHDIYDKYHGWAWRPV